MELPKKSKLDLSSFLSKGKKVIRNAVIGVGFASMALVSSSASAEMVKKTENNLDKKPELKDSSSKAFIMAQPKSPMEAADHYSHYSHSSHSSHSSHYSSSY